MALKWLVRRGEKISGPVSTDELRQKASAGILLPTDEISQPGQDNWLSAMSVKGLFQAEPAFDPPATGLTDRGHQNGSLERRSRVAPPPPAETAQPGQPAFSRSSSHVSKPPSSPALPAAADDDDDEFLADIRDRAASRRGPPPLPTNSPRSGLVLAKDADGFTRLMDANLVSEDAIVASPADEVRCPGCGNDHDKQERICPHCFREAGQTWQLVGSALRFLGIGACIALGLFGVQFLITVELSTEIKLLLSVTIGSMITGGLLWLKRAYGL